MGGSSHPYTGIYHGESNIIVMISLEDSQSIFPSRSNTLFYTEYYNIFFDPIMLNIGAS